MPPPVPAAHPGTPPLSHTLVDSEFRLKRLKLQLSEGQEALAAECVAQAQACFKQLQECTISSGTGASKSHKTRVGGELITVSSVLIRQTLHVLLE